MFLDERNSRVDLGRQIGSKGGEGCVFEVVGKPDFVAKCYHSPPSNLKIEKLRAQTESGDTDLRRIAAWPHSLLFKQNTPVGFLMPKVEGKPIHLLYRPVDRRENFPVTTWQNLVSVARNLAAAFHTLHSRGVLMADVNESNVLITRNGEARLIDCDSFQITTRAGTTYPCGVGVALWTPPELQGRAFGSLVRSEQHDAFGLAVLIFHLLFMGKHPFAGVPKSHHLLENPPSLEECIQKFQFAHSRRATVDFRAPPFSLSLSSLPDGVANLFEEAFLSSTRPAAAAWYRELGAIEFQKCQWGHIYFRRLADCPWCSIWNSGGPNFFIVASTLDNSGSSSAEIERLLLELEKASPPQLEDVTPQFASLRAEIFNVPSIDPTSLPAIATAAAIFNVPRYRAEYSIGWGLFIGAVLFTVVVPAGLLLWIVMAIFGWALIAGGSENPEFAQEIERRKKGPDNAMAAIRRHLETMKTANEAASREFDNAKWKYCADILGKEADAQTAFRKGKDRLKLQTAEVLRLYRSLPQRHEDLRKERLERSQKEDFLRKHRVASFRIAHIGPARSAILSNFGIVTAWDVKNMGWVPKLGQGNGELRAWVSRLEVRFRFDPKQPLSDIGEQDLRRDLLKYEKGVLDDYRSIRQKWHELLQLSSTARLRQLRAAKLSEHIEDLKEMNRLAIRSNQSNEERYQKLLSEYGEAKAKADACPA